MCPEDNAHRRYETDIINGPLDVDKLDYLTRDSYFTGINLAVDIDRLLPSLRITKVRNDERARDESRLVVDYRGIAVVEQLLFARMVLYDTVYHHHKVRAATQDLLRTLRPVPDRGGARDRSRAGAGSGAPRRQAQGAAQASLDVNQAQRSGDP